MNTNRLIIDHQISPIAHDDLDRLLSQRDESDTDLLTFFDEEASSELRKLEDLLRAWDGGGAPFPGNEMRICFHTLKGSANSIGQLRIGALAGGMESFLREVGDRDISSLRTELIKTTVQVMEAIKLLLMEAHDPQHNPVNKASLRQSVNLVLSLQAKAAQLSPT